MLYWAIIFVCSATVFIVAQHFYRRYLIRSAQYVGSLVVTETNETKVLSIEFELDPDEVDQMGVVYFRVKHVTQD